MSGTIFKSQKPKPSLNRSSNGASLRADIQDYAEGVKAKRADLAKVIATRGRAWDYTGMIGLLPDCDPVLMKRGDSAVILDDLMGDAHVTSVVISRKAGTLAREYNWLPGKEQDEEPTPQAKKLRDNFNANLKDIDCYNVTAQMLDAPYYGFTPIELKWKPRNGRIDLVGIEPKPHRWFQYDVDTNEPRFLTIDNMWDGEPLSPGKFVFVRHFPTFDNPYGMRLLSRCFWPVTFKRAGLKYWVTFAEKYGMPFLFGELPMNANEDDQDVLLSKLSSMVQDAVAALQNGTEVQVEQFSSTTTDTHERLKNAMDAEVSKVILGQTLTTEAGEKGARSLGEVHERVQDDRMEMDQKIVNTGWNQIAKIYAWVNGEGGNTLPPQHEWHEERDVKQELAERDKVVGESGRVKFTKTYYMREYGYQEDDFEVVEPSLPPNPEDPNNPTNGRPALPMTAFAEGETSRSQIEVDDFISRQIEVGAKVTQENARLILQAVQDADSPDDLQERLVALFDQIGDIDGILQQAYIAADMYGRFAVGQPKRELKPFGDLYREGLEMANQNA